MKKADCKPQRVPNSRLCLLLVMVLLSFGCLGQQSIIINMGPVDGIQITPDNIFNYQVQSSGPGKVQVKGVIRYRNSNLSASYTFSYALRQGINLLIADDIHPQWQFSSSALQELFFTYKVLPSGSYEYCVTITPDNVVKENTGGVFSECLYHRADDIFLINLISPENKAKLAEFNPMLVWVANYSFASELSYRLRVAEIKQGQNPTIAVTRNQPVFDESNLMQNSIVYPLYAKPLVVNQPYAWTVDAYYKGILLGSAETWQFIIPDTAALPVKMDMSYIDVSKEQATNHLTAFGILKLKYVLRDQRSEVLTLKILNAEKKECKISSNILNARYGDNRYELDLTEGGDFKHKAEYLLVVTTSSNKEYRLPFQYVNPGFIR